MYVIKTPERAKAIIDGDRSMVPVPIFIKAKRVAISDGVRIVGNAAVRKCVAVERGPEAFLLMLTDIRAAQ